MYMELRHTVNKSAKIVDFKMAKLNSLFRNNLL